MAAPSRFCVFWIRKTMRKVTMVVPVLMINCQVSEYPKIGPVAAQTRITITQSANVIGRPDSFATAAAKAVNALEKTITLTPQSLKGNVMLKLVFRQEARPSLPETPQVGGAVGAFERLLPRAKR